MVAPPVPAAGTETAPWSKLIDISDFDDDADADATDDRPRWSQSFRRRSRGLGRGAIGLRCLPRCQHAEVPVRRQSSQKTLNADASPEARCPSRSSTGIQGDKTDDKQKSARTGVPVATLDPQPRRMHRIESRSSRTASSRRHSRLGDQAGRCSIARHVSAGHQARGRLVHAATTAFREIASFQAPRPWCTRRGYSPITSTSSMKPAETPRPLGWQYLKIRRIRTSSRVIPAAWTQLAFAADGRTALALNEDRTLSVWDLETQASRPFDLATLPESTGFLSRLTVAELCTSVGDAIHVRDLVTNRDKAQGGRIDSANRRKSPSARTESVS